MSYNTNIDFNNTMDSEINVDSELFFRQHSTNNILSSISNCNSYNDLKLSNLSTSLFRSRSHSTSLMRVGSDEISNDSDTMHESDEFNDAISESEEVCITIPPPHSVSDSSCIEDFQLLNIEEEYHSETVVLKSTVTEADSLSTTRANSVSPRVGSMGLQSNCTTNTNRLSSMSEISNVNLQVQQQLLNDHLVNYLMQSQSGNRNSTLTSESDPSNLNCTPVPNSEDLIATHIIMKNIPKSKSTVTTENQKFPVIKSLTFESTISTASGTPGECSPKTSFCEDGPEESDIFCTEVTKVYDSSESNRKFNISESFNSNCMMNLNSLSQMSLEQISEDSSESSTVPYPVNSPEVQAYLKHLQGGCEPCFYFHRLCSKHASCSGPICHNNGKCHFCSRERKKSYDSHRRVACSKKKRMAIMTQVQQCQTNGTSNTQLQQSDVTGTLKAALNLITTPSHQNSTDLPKTSSLILGNANLNVTSLLKPVYLDDDQLAFTQLQSTPYGRHFLNKYLGWKKKYSCVIQELAEEALENKKLSSGNGCGNSAGEPLGFESCMQECERHSRNSNSNSMSLESKNQSTVNSNMNRKNSDHLSKTQKAAADVNTKLNKSESEGNSIDAKGIIDYLNAKNRTKSLNQTAVQNQNNNKNISSNMNQTQTRFNNNAPKRNGPNTSNYNSGLLQSKSTYRKINRSASMNSQIQMQNQNNSDWSTYNDNMAQGHQHLYDHYRNLAANQIQNHNIDHYQMNYDLNSNYYYNTSDFGTMPNNTMDCNWNTVPQY